MEAVNTSKLLLKSLVVNHPANHLRHSIGMYLQVLYLKSVVDNSATCRMDETNHDLQLQTVLCDYRNVSAQRDTSTYS